MQLDPARLAANGVSVDQVAQAISATDMVEAAGRTDRDYRQYAIVVSGLTNTPDAVGRVVVRESGPRPVRVADLGTVGYGAEDLFQIVAGNGRPAALVNISRQPNGNTLRLQAAVRAAMDSSARCCPPACGSSRSTTRPRWCGESMASVRDAMLLGGALAVLVLLLFLGEWRTTAAAALSLPLTVAITLLGLALAGDSLNLMSLGGLAVAIGIIIDDAVVVVENIERRLALHPDAAAGGGGADAAPTRSSGRWRARRSRRSWSSRRSGLLTGVVGEFFRSFAHRARGGGAALAGAGDDADPGGGGAVGGARGPPSRRGAGRARFPRLSLRAWRSATAGRSAGCWRTAAWRSARASALLALGLGLSRVIGTGFLPEMDEGGFILDYWAPTGAALSETDRQVRVLEGILLADPAVQAFTRRTGSELGFAATSPNRGDFTVLLKPRGAAAVGLRGHGSGARAAEERAPAVRVEFVQLMQDVIGDLAGAPEPVELKLFSRDQAAAERAARAVAAAIEPTPGLVDLFDGVQGPNPERRVELDPARVARLGLTAREVQAQARAALFGADAGTAREPDRLVPIRVRLPDSVRCPGRRHRAGADRRARRLAAAGAARRGARHRRARASCCARICGPTSP